MCHQRVKGQYPCSEACSCCAVLQAVSGGPHALLASLTDFSDSLLPPSLAHLSLPPLDAATAGWAARHTGQDDPSAAWGLRQTGQGDASAAAASGQLARHGSSHPLGALPLLSQPGEAAVYGVEADLEIGLGSLLGAGGESWLGLPSHRNAPAPCSQAARKSFHMLFPTSS